MNNEEEEEEELLFENIKIKNVIELKNFLKENNIKPENFNTFNKILLYFIKNENETSIDIIHFIIEQQQKYPKNIIDNNKNKEALFYSIQNNKFKIADLLLLNNNISLNSKDFKSNPNENILEY
ncbi:hypothetical protein BCR32DRAFT_286808 [Anaeromyces robustus]|uniref:Uncharacterized protein n=1 Tax=Anaeromyces robustus TaxID=1754192 RepID=A0A1Y1VU78_9FUNG|nr:hypothetical protein BCR32DRAFT_286808 [Anaeromyces robustus]|eukprot:ORX64860.1 hypothetical protein BCR32DRAFT_286808 [Anaeromyces robustus]